ncbi:MAG: Lrp/AsnC family transcriptional regulator [Burkholderiaceae bacterium]|nr:Lrp/AsnC family transcriptional regulator [Burkholderiaceae bacterium]
MARAVVLPPGIDAAGYRLLNDWQRGFPLESRPFAVLAAQVGLAEDAVIAAYRDWITRGLVSRIGAVFAPHRLGASALVALAAPPSKLAAVAARVSAEPGVNHNYEREHRFNLWFVVTAADAQALAHIVDAIGRDTGCPVIRLPLLEEYHIDLACDPALDAASGMAPDAMPGVASARPRTRGLHRAAPTATSGGTLPGGTLPGGTLPGGTLPGDTLPGDTLPGDTMPGSATPGGTPSGSTTPGAAPSARQRRVLAALQEGLPLVAAPYAELGRRTGLGEAEVLDTIAAAQSDGLIRRFGVVLRHHELGLGANAMCVWDVPDDVVGECGRRLAGEPLVTLCYRRPRALPDWRYNLFCMIHGSERTAVLAARDDIAARLGLDAWPHAVLFSGRRFKQRGARYLPQGEGACHA